MSCAAFRTTRWGGSLNQCGAIQSRAPPLFPPTAISRALASTAPSFFPAAQGLKRTEHLHPARGTQCLDTNDTNDSSCGQEANPATTQQKRSTKTKRTIVGPDTTPNKTAIGCTAGHVVLSISTSKPVTPLLFPALPLLFPGCLKLRLQKRKP
jgi:hypothetical protein